MQNKSTRTLVSLAFEGDAPPPQLSVGIVSLVELCQLSMPRPQEVRARLAEAGFVGGTAEEAAKAGQMLNLEAQVVAGRLRNVKHDIFAFEREGQPVIILLSIGDSDEGQIVFCSAIFRGAFEADVVKAVAHVTKRQPFTGANARTAHGKRIRRVFWHTENESGVRSMMITGPGNVESTTLSRAITAFNKAQA